MNQNWLPLQGVPWGYLVLAARLSRGLRQQPRIVHAWSPDRFAQAVNRAGGAAAVRKGLVVDGVLIAMSAGATVPPLRAADGPWVVPVAAAGLDTLEGLILASLLDG